MNEQSQDTSQKDLIVNSSVQMQIDEGLDKVFTAEPELMLEVTEQLLGTLDPDQQSEAYEPIKLALESAWHYAHALTGVMTGGLDFAHAVELYNQAANGFNELGIVNLRDLSIGMAYYSQAVVDLRQSNVTLAIERFREVEGYLENAGKFSSKFKPLIDHMKPEMLFASSIPALQQLDFATAQTLTEEASKAAEYTANTYYSEEDPQKLMFNGSAHFYRAFYLIFKSHSDLQQFEYDRIAQDVELIESGRKAREALMAAKTFSEPVRALAEISETLVPLAEVIHSLAKLMKRVFESTFTPDLGELRELRRKLRRASESAAKAGPHAVALVRFCENIANQIKNLERLLRPTKKDFGIYSGLIAAGIFVFLLVATSWANSAFQLGLGANKIITTITALALIAGFGFGAVKFKSLFLPKQDNEKNSG